MNLLAYLILTLAKVIDLLVTLYTYIVVGAVLISWVNPDPYNPIVRFLRQLTEPVFSQVRRLLPRSLLYSRIDFSPLLVFIALMLLDTTFVRFLFNLAHSLLKKEVAG